MFDSTYIHAEADKGVLVVTLKCEKVSEYESTVIQGELANLYKGFSYKIALDFTQVMFMSSVGLGMLVSINRLCKTNKGKLALFAMNDNLRSLLKIMKLDSGFTIVADQAAAVKAIG